MVKSLLIFFAALTGGIDFASPQSADILTLLRQADSRMLCSSNPPGTNTAYLSSFILREEHKGMNSGEAKIMNCEMLWADDFTMITETPVYAHDPEPLPSQSQDTYLERRLLKDYVLFNKERHESRQEFENYVFDRSGKMIRTSFQTVLNKYPIGNRRVSEVHLFDDFCQALGRGFGDTIGEITSQTAGGPDDPLSHLEAKLKNGAGKWSVKYEAGADNLIREANLTPSGENKPYIVVTNSGVAECPGLKMASSGTYKIYTYSREFQVMTLTNIYLSGDTFKHRLEECVAAIDAPLPENQSKIVDNRGPDIKIINN